MTNQPVPKVSRADVLRIARREFPDTAEDEVMAILDRYGVKPYQQERDRVQLAALKLAGGKLNELRRHIEVACTDYRDVLMAAEYPADALRHPGAPGDHKTFQADWEQYATWFARK